MRDAVSCEASFLELWTLWRDHARKTDGRGKARPTYRKWILEGAEPADILDGVRWHLFSMKDADRPYIPLLASYLNSERWLDDAEHWRAYQAKLAAREQQKQEPKVVQMPQHKTAFAIKYEQMKAQG